jgi:hypothetical protein
MNFVLTPATAGVDLVEDRRPTIIATLVITWVLAIVAVGLRLLGRYINNV